MKKFIALILALIFALGIAVVAAAGDNDPDITVTGYDINISDELKDVTTVILINEKGKITEEKYPGVRACITVETNEQVKINEFICNADDGEIQIVFTLPVNYAVPATVITTEPETEPEITEPETTEPESEETTVIIPVTVEETEPAPAEPEEEETSVIIPVPAKEPEPETETATVILPEPEPETMPEPVPETVPETVPVPEPTMPSTVPTSIKEGSAGGGAKDGSGRIGGGSSSSGGKVARPTTKAAVEEKEAEEETVVIVPQGVTAIPYTGSGKMTKVIAVVIALCGATGAAYYCTSKKED